MIHKRFNRYPKKHFSKQLITHEIEFFFFFSFMIQGSDKCLIIDGPSFLWSICSHASCWFWLRENKSWNLIGYFPRKVYWKILHCRLRRISTNALTHVRHIWSQEGCYSQTLNKFLSQEILGACENIHKVTADKWIHYDTVSAEVHCQLWDH